MSTSSTHIPKPKDWQAFERQMEVLAQEWLGDPFAQAHGRTGQSQAGVDVYGRQKNGNWVGIQCKKKFEQAVTEKELRHEVNAARSFKPAIETFILATTAPRDEGIQEVARTLTAEGNGFSVHVWSWEDIEGKVSEYPRAIKAFDPAYNPLIAHEVSKLSLKQDAYAESISEQGEKIDRLLALSELQVSSANSASKPQAADDDDQSTQRHGKISLIQSLVDDEILQIADKKLAELKREEWTNATESERYRMKVVEANIAIKREQFDIAGKLLLEAGKELPTHKNAKFNIAIGNLLNEDMGEAERLITEILEAEPTDQRALEVLVQIRVRRDATDPFDGIAPEQMRTPMMWALRANHERLEGHASWRQTAKDGLKEYPDDRFLRRYAAEAVIDACLSEAKSYMMGEGTTSVTSTEVEEAAAELADQIKHLHEIGGRIVASTGHNAVLANRLARQFDLAAELLHISVDANPDDQPLREQLAILKLTIGDFPGVVQALEGHERTLGADMVLAEAYMKQSRFDDALELIELHSLPCDDPLHTYQVLGTKLGWAQQQGKLKEGLEELAELVERYPNDAVVRLFLLKVTRQIGDNDAKEAAVKAAVACVDANTPFVIANEIADQAYDQGELESAFEILKDRVPVDRDSPALSLCMAAALNGGFHRQAKDFLAKFSPKVRKKPWYRRAEISLYNRIGDSRLEGLVNQFLKDYPHDVEVKLIQIGLWQTQNRPQKIRNELKRIDFQKLSGPRHSIMQLLRVQAAYGDLKTALPVAYRMVLQNWDDLECHLAYQGLFFAHDPLENRDPEPTKIGIGTAFTLSEGAERKQFRIERELPEAFGSEWLSPTSDMALALSGHAVGDVVTIEHPLRNRSYKVEEIKSVQLDVFHRSINSFNTRFPGSSALVQMNLDMSSPDPLREMRRVVKSMAERDQMVLTLYKEEPVSIAWMAGLLGKDPIDCAFGLKSQGIKIRACIGTADERKLAADLIDSFRKKGVVVDGFTAKLIRMLEVEDAVTAICGPLHTSQTTIELFASRFFEAKAGVGRKQGFMSWYNGKLQLVEISEDANRQMLQERKDDFDWANRRLTVLPALPKADLTGAAKETIDIVGASAVAPVLAADGADMPLLVEDMGARIWAKQALNLEGTWLQPVLMRAVDEGVLDQKRYAKCLELMNEIGLSYVSFDPPSILSILEDGNDVISRAGPILQTICGVDADLDTNLAIVARAIKLLQDKGEPRLVLERLASDAARSTCYPRWKDSVTILNAFNRILIANGVYLTRHLREWYRFNTKILK